MSKVLTFAAVAAAVVLPSLAQAQVVMPPFFQPEQAIGYYSSQQRLPDSGRSASREARPSAAQITEQHREVQEHPPVGYPLYAPF